MILSSIFFVLSGLFLAIVWFGRAKESAESPGRLGAETVSQSWLKLGSSQTDQRLHALYMRISERIQAIDAHSTREFLHRIAESVEKTTLRATAKALNKFGRITDAVTGKDLPKNKGSVSFFLKHIENHKRSHKRKQTMILPKAQGNPTDFVKPLPGSIQPLFNPLQKTIK